MEKSDTPQGQDNTAKDTNQSKNKGRDSKSVATGPKSTPTSEKEDKSESPNNSSKAMAWLKKHVTPTLVVEILVFLVATYVACIYSRQLNEMIESNRLNRESLESVQRAFINISVIKHLRLTEKDGSHAWSVSPLVENSGTTPATMVINRVHWSALPQEPDDLTFKGNEQNFPVSTIGPKGQMQLGPLFETEAFIFGADFGDLIPPIKPLNTKPRGKPVFIWIWIGYRDIFDHPHVTESCAEILETMYVSPDGKDIQWTPRNCYHHNCTDKNCEDYQAIEGLIPKRR
jgi:hypothetical protein